MFRFQFVKKIGLFVVGLSACLHTLSTWSYSPYTNRELDELEKEFIQQINFADNIVRNPLANQYINHLGKILATHGQLRPPYFFIVKSNEINAFAGPGGYIGVNSQLILATESEGELAAVMAHEMAHVRLHHLYRMLEHQQQMRIPMLAAVLASMALGVINPGMGTGAMMASMSGFAQDNINFVRSNEKEADRIGIDMLIRSGKNPNGMASFFKKMQESARYYYTDNIPAILRTHPADSDRIAEAENRSAALSKQTDTDPLDYQLFKELIRVSVAGNNKQILDYYERACKNPNSGIPCQYGYTLALIDTNRYQQAFEKLSPLIQQAPNNLDFQITMAEIELGLKRYKDAITRLRNLQSNYPDNYAVMFSLAQGLLASGDAKASSGLLLKASRLFKNDVPICRELAQALAADHRKGQAYFTQAQCQLLQGQKHIAMQQLLLAKRIAKHDHLLSARIDAKIEEVKELIHPE